MRKNYILFIIILIVINSCDSIYIKQITGNLYLVASDSMDDLSLSYYSDKFDVYEGIVSGGIYFVATNNDYILIQKHPYADSFSRLKLNANVTEYYIVRIINDNSSYDAKKCLGPFNKEEFEIKKNELKIVGTHEFYSKN